jgi:Spy/CpxP family protein refolding chaperone
MNPMGIRWILLSIVATLPLACDKTESPAPPVSSQTAPVVRAPGPSGGPSASASGRRADRRRPRGGVGVVPQMLEAADGLELKDEQKAAIDKLEEQMTGDRGGPNEFKEYRTALIAGIRAGKIDTAAMAPLKANLEKAMQARKDKEAERLNALYAALEPAQRKTLVAAFRAKQIEREARFDSRRGDGGAPAASASASASAKPPEGEWKKQRTERLTKDLDLDAAQQKSVDALFAKGEHPTPALMETMREERKKRMDAMLTAFEGEGFDAKKLDLWPMDAKKMGQGTDRHLQSLTQLLAILKPEQREKLASRMDQGARGAKTGYPVDDESGFGYFFDEPHHGEQMPPRLH